MRREYKGFYIEGAAKEYRTYHVVTGNLGVVATSVTATKELIDDIHRDDDAYAACAGVSRVDVVKRRGRLVTRQGRSK